MNTDPLVSLRCLSWKLGVPRKVLEHIAETAAHHYKPFFLRVAGKKKPRQIDNPNKDLKNVQHRIHSKLLSSVEFPEYLHGGIKGRSQYTNAIRHLGQPWVVRIDIRDFFPSVTNRHVYSIWVDKLGCSPPVARLLTALTTYRHRLPQGSSTSSSLANLVLLEADEKINTQADLHSCSYTRLVDDLAFSGDDPMALIQGTIQILRLEGFSISRTKLTVMSSSECQELAGLAVNSRKGPSYPRYRRDHVRAAIRALPQGEDFSGAVTSIKGRIGHFSKSNPGSASACLRYLNAAIQRARQSDDPAPAGDEPSRPGPARR